MDLDCIQLTHISIHYDLQKIRCENLGHNNLHNSEPYSVFTLFYLMI